MERAGHAGAGRGEHGAGSLRLAKELLTVVMVVGGQTHLEWGYAITMSTSLTLEQRAELFRRQPKPTDGGKTHFSATIWEPDRIGQGQKIFTIAVRHRQSGIGLTKRAGNTLASSSCMLGCTGRPGQQGSAGLRLAIEQAPWWTQAGRMENAIVDDLDVLDRMADLSSPPAAAEAAGLQKTDYFRRRSGTRAIWRRTTGLQHRSSASLVRHWPDGVGREVFVCLSLSL